MKILTKFVFLAILMCLSLITGHAMAAVDGTSFPKLKEQYYRDHPGKGKHGQYWEAIPIQKYWNPKDFYKPPSTVPGEVKRDMCVACHQSITPGAYHAWKNSTHANLEALRNLTDANDPRFYKKQKLAEVERNLMQQQLLKEGEKL